jgi:hypothetical protein
LGVASSPLTMFHGLVVRPNESGELVIISLADYTEMCILILCEADSSGDGSDAV